MSLDYIHADFEILLLFLKYFLGIDTLIDSKEKKIIKIFLLHLATKTETLNQQGKFKYMFRSKYEWDGELSKLLA